VTDIFDDWEVPVLPCSMLRKVTVMAGALSLCALSGVLIVHEAMRRWLT
jgi:hypothetical protein